MNRVYEKDNFIGRVNFAASYIAANRRTTRTFDTCFEMGDGEAVAQALWRRAHNRPNGKLAAKISKYLAAL